MVVSILSTYEIIYGIFLKVNNLKFYSMFYKGNNCLRDIQNYDLVNSCKEEISLLFLHQQKACHQAPLPLAKPEKIIRKATYSN